MSVPAASHTECVCEVKPVKEETKLSVKEVALSWIKGYHDAFDIYYENGRVSIEPVAEPTTDHLTSRVSDPSLRHIEVKGTVYYFPAIVEIYVLAGFRPIRNRNNRLTFVRI